MSNDHYKARGGMQPIEFIEANQMDFLEGNVIKYVHRYKHKDGVKDLTKARDYLDRIIKREATKEAAFETLKLMDKYEVYRGSISGKL